MSLALAAARPASDQLGVFGQQPSRLWPVASGNGLQHVGRRLCRRARQSQTQHGLRQADQDRGRTTELVIRA